MNGSSGSSGSAQPLLTRLGHYELVRLLAEGGMADIYLARQDGSDRQVAVKVLNAERAADPEARALFIDEARLASMLDHANLARVYEVDAIDDVIYLAMEYIDGADLREVLALAVAKHGAVAYDCAVSIVCAAAAGLDHAHRRCGPDGRPLHLVHRDVSLSNIMVAHDGTVKVIDFGIASSATSLHRTNPGVVRGKASYMSPQQCLGDPLDLRTDVFALGVVLYELTTGHRCFEGTTELERMLAVVRGAYVAPSLVVPGYPIELEHIIGTALSEDPARRYPSAAAMLHALQDVARRARWTLGTTRISKMMRALFGHAPCLVIDDAHDLTFVGPPPVRSSGADEVPQVTAVMRRRRFARGTSSDTHAHDCLDDAPTRGRRSMRRLASSPLVAA